MQPLQDHVCVLHRLLLYMQISRILLFFALTSFILALCRTQDGSLVKSFFDSFFSTMMNDDRE
jgi:hypothetical protein